MDDFMKSLSKIFAMLCLAKWSRKRVALAMFASAIANVVLAGNATTMPSTDTGEGDAPLVVHAPGEPTRNERFQSELLAGIAATRGRKSSDVYRALSEWSV